MDLLGLSLPISTMGYMCLPLRVGKKEKQRVKVP